MPGRGDRQAEGADPERPGGELVHACGPRRRQVHPGGGDRDQLRLRRDRPRRPRRGQGRSAATPRGTAGAPRSAPIVAGSARRRAAAAAAGSDRVAPTYTALPAITGESEDMQTLTVSNGTWNGTAPTRVRLPVAALLEGERRLQADRGRDRRDLHAHRRRHRDADHGDRDRQERRRPVRRRREADAEDRRRQAASGPRLARRRPAAPAAPAEGAERRVHAGAATTRAAAGSRASRSATTAAS